jgi:uncharacterized protein YdiU (UPF0061 family)
MAAVRKSITHGHETYQGFDDIDGTHPLGDKVLGAFVEYGARYRKGGKIAFFNYDLAREMGLISSSHSNQMTRALEEKLLKTFGITIVNEWDVLNNKMPKQEELSPNRYMATRYLQLQHQSKVGKTSGDGRSIWNGFFKAKNKTWDISSCGTGATCLSPAYAKHRKFFKTGDPEVSYGCGMADVKDGITNAMFSELLHKDGVPTERTLCVLEFSAESAVVVRASPNLFRPSHFFIHLRQRNIKRLRSTVDIFIERQISNKDWPGAPKSRDRKYWWFAEQFARTFAEMVARFEREYIFCWLDWDGDNIMADGRLIDYGSIRRFGVFHHKYRFDDVERWSTNILEQRLKARATVQTIVQMVDYLVHGECRPLVDFKNHKFLEIFDETFWRERHKHLLYKFGFDGAQAETLMEKHQDLVIKFARQHDSLEKRLINRRAVRVQDGSNQPALFNMNQMRSQLALNVSVEPHQNNIKDLVLKSLTKYCSGADRKVALKQCGQVRSLLVHLKKIHDSVREGTRGKNLKNQEKQFLNRALNKNRVARITGDGMIFIGQLVSRKRKTLSPEQLYVLMLSFLERYNTDGDIQKPKSSKRSVIDLQSERVLKKMDSIIDDCFESL